MYKCDQFLTDFGDECDFMTLDENMLKKHVKENHKSKANVSEEGVTVTQEKPEIQLDVLDSENSNQSSIAPDPERAKDPDYVPEVTELESADDNDSIVSINSKEEVETNKGRFGLTALQCPYSILLRLKSQISDAAKFVMCHFCPKVFLGDALEKHISNVHYGRILKKKYDSTPNSIITINRTHMQCALCNLHFNHVGVVSHFSLQHKEFCREKRFPVCVQCSQPTWFVNQNDYVDHECEKTRSIREYNDHCEAFFGETFFCEDCPDILEAMSSHELGKCS